MSQSETTPTRAAPTRGRTYVLIHGAWFGGWVWKNVANALRGMGHTVYRPTMTGLGERRHLLRPGINLDTHTDDVVNVMEMEDLNDVVLVGWSYGGMVMGDVIARVPQRISSMVYLDAFIPERGKSQANFPQRIGTQDQLLQRAIEGKDIPPFPMAGMGITDQAIIDYATPRLGPHPIGTILQASKAPVEWPAVSHTYILAGGYPNTTFRPFHNKFVEEKLGEAYVLDTSHATMLTDPRGTTELLHSVR